MSARIIIGGIFILIGGLFFLDQLNVLDAQYFISLFWPAIFILAGLADLLQKPRNYLWSGILITFGSILLLNRSGILDENAWNYLWPLVLVTIGLTVLFNIGKGGYSKTSKDQGFSISAIFSGRDYKNANQNLMGGEVVALFGGAEIDLSKAKPAEKTISLNITAVFGGVELRIPEDWNVEVRVTPLFGGVENNSSVDSSKPYTLVVNGLAIFGGLEIKS